MCLVTFLADRRINRILVRLNKGTPGIAHSVEGTGFNEGFDRALIRDRQRYFAEEVVE